MNEITVEIACKPYVKIYIENNCGNPADLKNLPHLHQVFMHALKRAPKRFDYKKIANYHSSIRVILDEVDLYKYGWELTKTGIAGFNKSAEYKVKFMMRSFISLNESLDIPLKSSIKEFQSLFGFSENDWSYESIKSDYIRHGNQFQIDSILSFKKELQKILLCNLSDLGTISNKYIESFFQ